MEEEQAEPDIEVTVASSIAATQEALQAAESASEPPPDSGSAEEPASEPAPPPPVDNNPELQLPFWDDFDQGLDPTWRVINGKPLIVEGRLTSASDELSLNIGNTQLKNYTLEMDVGGEDCGTGYSNYLTLGFSPMLMYRIKYIDFGGRAVWLTYEDSEWDKLISGGDRLDCGHFRIVVNGASYTIFINEQMAEDILFESAQGPLLIKLDENVFIDNVSITP